MQIADEGPWELELQGFEVLGLFLGGYQVSFSAYGENGASGEVILSEPFTLTAPDGAHQVITSGNCSWEQLAPLLVFHSDVIRVVRATATSDLHVEFESGYTIDCSARDDGEAWEVNAPGNVKFIGMPGGREPAIWDGDPAKTIRVRFVDGRFVDADGNEVTRLSAPD